MDAVFSGGINMIAAGASGTSQLLVPTGLALITLALLMRYRKRRSQQAHATRLTPHEEVERGRQYRGLRGDLEKQGVELTEKGHTTEERMACSIEAMRNGEECEACQ